MNSKDLELLLSLAREGSLSRAAKQLYITQPALTRRIQQLEQDFSCQLLIRVPRGVEFTPAGQLLARCAERLSVDLQTTREQISMLDTDIRGILKIACSNVYAKYRLPQMLSLFCHQYPNVEVHLRSGIAQEVYRSALEGQVHLCIVRGEYRWPGPNRLLGIDGYCIVSAAPFQLEELPTLSMVHYVTDVQLQNEVDAWWFSHFNVPPRIDMEIDSTETCLQIVRRGLGYAILSELNLDDTQNLYRKPLIFSDGTPLLRQTRLCWRKEKLAIPAVRAFVKFVTETVPCPKTSDSNSIN